MSENTTTFNNGQQMQVNTNLKKLFPYGKEMLAYVYTAAGAITLPAGTVMGVVKATGKVVPVTSAAVNGSAEPIGVLAKDYVITAAGDYNVYVAIQGRVRQDMLIFQGADTIATVVGEHRYFEWLLRCGILPTAVTNATKFDNTLT